MVISEIVTQVVRMFKPSKFSLDVVAHFATQCFASSVHLKLSSAFNNMTCPTTLPYTRMVAQSVEAPPIVVSTGLEVSGSASPPRPYKK